MKSRSTELQGARCPACQAQWHIEIEVVAWMKIDRYGLSAFLSATDGPEYDGSSGARCTLCNWKGRVRDLDGIGNGERTESEKVAEKMRDDYLEHGGRSCPYCASTKMSSYTPEYVVGGIAVTHTCSHCGSVWEDIYTMSDVDFHTTPDEEAAVGGSN